MAAEISQTNEAPLTYHMDLEGVRHDLERARRMEPNISRMERIGSGVAGGALAALGFSRRSIPGAILGMIGLALLERGMTGHCSVYEKMGRSTAEE